MLAPSRPVYEQDPIRGEELHDSLSAMHHNILAGGNNPGVLALNHTARVGDWDITLGTSGAGELDAASMIRCGQESYSFVRTGDKSWAAAGIRHLFEDAHYFNLVNMATREGAEWTDSPRIS